MALKKHKKLLLILLAVIVVLVITVPIVVVMVSKLFTAQEHAVRTDWSFETGDVFAENEEWQVEFAEA